MLKAAEIPTINPVATATASPAAEAAEILAGMQVHLIGQQQLVVKKRGRGRPHKDGTPARSCKDKHKVAEMLLFLHGSAVADHTVTKWDDKWLQHFRVLQVSVLLL